MIVYVDVDFETSLIRTENRDKRKFTWEEKATLKYFINKLKEEVINYSANKNIPLLIIDGRDDIYENANKIFMKIKNI